MRYLYLILLATLIACGNDSGSSKKSGSTGAVYVYQTEEVLPQDMGDVTAINARCQAAFATHSPTVSCTKFLGLLGRTATNGIQGFISHHGMSGSSSVKLVDGTTIASSFSSFISGPPAMDGANWAGWPETTWYSGVVASGAVGNNCTDWTDFTSNPGSPYLNYGSNSTTPATWHSGNTYCNYYAGYRHLCVCY